jgi:hypothetical protein
VTENTVDSGDVPCAQANLTCNLGKDRVMSAKQNRRQAFLPGGGYKLGVFEKMATSCAYECP